MGIFASFLRCFVRVFLACEKSAKKHTIFTSSCRLMGVGGFLLAVLNVLNENNLRNMGSEEESLFYKNTKPPKVPEGCI